MILREMGLIYHLMNHPLSMVIRKGGNCMRKRNSLGIFEIIIFFAITPFSFEFDSYFDFIASSPLRKHEK